MRSQILFQTFLSFVLHSTTLAAPTIQDAWYQPADSPVASLFQKRAPSPTDPNFASNYPPAGQSPPNSSLPAAWLAKLASVTMPSVSVSMPNNGYPTYAAGEKGGDETICSFTYACTTKDDLYNPPDGVIALSFDDGPAAASPTLNDFLTRNNISSKATHFMIGGSILYNPTGMQAAVNAGGHIAVHTWSHQYTTTLTNEQVLGELGWTMQIISDLNGGRIPKFWRPPFGDVDNRVRAIAKGVFGLETVVWNQDSADWAIGNNPAYTRSGVETTMTGLLTGKKSPGLCFLEHELNNNTVGVFMDIYPAMASNGWKIETIADAWNMSWYQNTDNSNTGNVTTMSVGAAGLAVANATSTMSSTASSTSTSTSTSSSSSTTVASLAGATSASVSPIATAAAAATTSKTGGADRGSSFSSAAVLAVVGLLAAMII